MMTLMMMTLMMIVIISVGVWSASSTDAIRSLAKCRPGNGAPTIINSILLVFLTSNKNCNIQGLNSNNTSSKHQPLSTASTLCSISYIYIFNIRSTVEKVKNEHLVHSPATNYDQQHKDHHLQLHQKSDLPVPKLNRTSRDHTWYLSIFVHHRTI